MNTRDFQTAFLHSLLTRDSERGFRALLKTWADAIYDSPEYDWIPVTYERHSWVEYARRVSTGERPFPWPDSFTKFQRTTATQVLIRQTIALVRNQEPARAQILFGLHDPSGESAPDTARAPQAMLGTLASITGAAGQLADQVCAAIQDDVIDDVEATDISAACDRLITIAYNLKQAANAAAK